MVCCIAIVFKKISIATSPDYNHLRKSLQDVLLSMRFGLTRDLLLKRSSFAYYSGSREQHPITMATKSDKTSTTEVKDKVVEDKKKDNDKKEEVSLPPPPEKPEPGDCCGSGCVRCVWDVYYDQLEEYNKLSASTPPGDSKSN
ncbi:unnamed protein product [Eruca vesicaria subsp. sativa]|uniref:Oxidoreductase-like domain-containing protein n=1 Tax=Eruca vesicaria subsp. sativa TaxID=29727 RepID=A0ABC8JAG9_ERUVS|nr:unnamed protein product [Eruca vesicaria subsp. sativa]